jgi:D-alanyl-D-alanine carboxypeptidase
MLDDHLDAVLDCGVPGVLVVAVSSGHSWEKAAGVADLQTGAPLSLEHRFRISSATKLFVAAVVLQLVDEGAFALDGEVGLIEGRVTVRQLLNHTSGLPHGLEIDELIEPYRTNPEHRPEWTPREMLGLVEARPRLFSPGEGWSYTGSNYVVLGLLIEEATGATLSEALRRRIIDPLELADTELPGLGSTPDGLARGYIPADHPLRLGEGPGPIDVTNVEPFGWGGGGMVSTGADVARFLRALLGGELLSPAMHTELLTTVPSDWDESDRYGLGIEEVTSIGEAESPCDVAWGHFGFAIGHSTVALGSVDGERQVVVMFNTHPMTMEVWSAIGRLTWASYCA